MKTVRVRKKVLIVDDDSVIVQGIQTVYELANYSVESMTTGKGIYQIIAETKPDVIILDILLDGSDGREVVKKLKRNPKTAHIPIILVSAAHDIEQSVIETGADDFIAKPFSVSELLKKTERVLRVGTAALV